MLESVTLVVRGSTVKMALSVYLDDFTSNLGTHKQLENAEYSKTLLIIPKTHAIKTEKDTEI